jgi:chemotaxis protein methyltransferase CheR
MAWVEQARVDKQTFDRFRDLIRQRSGIALAEGKEALLCARLARRMRVLAMADHDAYLEYVIHDGTGSEMVQLLDAVSTNVTSFFREPQHFEFISQVMEQWLAQGQRRFRFWSAACSTGEEPYSLAITLSELLRGYRVDLKILATDISTRVLERAMEGIYEEDRLGTTPAALRERYFHCQRHGGGVHYVAKSSIRDLITFSRLNLSQPPFPMHGPMDIILCRNVMIYFDNPVRKRLLAELHRLSKRGGYLLVGHAESLTGMVSAFTAVRPSIYTR